MGKSHLLVTKELLFCLFLWSLVVVSFRLSGTVDDLVVRLVGDHHQQQPSSFLLRQQNRQSQLRPKLHYLFQEEGNRRAKRKKSLRPKHILKNLNRQES